MNDDKPTAVKKLLELVKNNWSWCAPLIYIYVTAVGMMQSWLHFRSFDINVFDFAEINDFLLVAFREPESFLYIVGLILYLSLLVPIAYKTHYWIHYWIYFWIHFWAKKWNKESLIRASKNSFDSSYFSHRLGKYLNLLIIFVSLIFAPYFVPNYILNDEYGTHWQQRYVNDSKRIFTVTLRDTLTSNCGLVLLGTTEKYIFFLPAKSKSIYFQKSY